MWLHVVKANFERKAQSCFNNPKYYATGLIKLLKVE